MPNPYNDYPYLIIEDFLSHNACDEILQYIHQDSQAQPAMIKSLQVGIVQPDVNEDIRKITTILFLTSQHHQPQKSFQFNGGELVFNYLFDEKGEQIKILPKAGMMIVFPSNPLYSHEVLPVISGLRLTLVQWYNGIIV